MKIFIVLALISIPCFGQNVSGTSSGGVSLSATPTWTGSHIWNSGGASSPSISFVDFARTWQMDTGRLSSGRFELFETGTSFTAIAATSTEVRIGSQTNIAANQSRLYVFGGANGANQDIQGDGTAGAAADQATMELESSDYQTNTNSLLMQYKGVNATGTTLGFSNANLGRIFWGNAATALVYTSNTTPIVFGTNSLERMRLLNGYQLNLGVAGTGSGILGLNGSTSGTVTFTAPAVAGTTTNSVVISNSIQVPGINAGTLALSGTSGAISNVAATATMGMTLKKGSGAGNYTTASTTYVVTDSTNLCFSVVIPTGWKLGIQASGGLGTATAVVQANAALTDNAVCSTANAGVLTEAVTFGNAAGNTESFSLNWVVTGDGATHAVALQFKTSNAGDSATLLNSTATLLPTITYTLMPSN